MTLTKTAQNILALISAVALIATTIVLTEQPKDAHGEIFSSGCSAMTLSVKEVGNQASVLVVATTSNRAALHIQQPDNATNTVYFNFSYASATVAASTWILEKVSATGTVRELNLGKASLFPYNGPITARTDRGSTTILVTECIY